MTHHNGNLIVSADNIEYARSVTSVSGYVSIRAEGADLSALTKARHVYIYAEGANLSALTKAGYVYIYAEGADLSALTEAGNVYIDAEGADLSALTKAGNVYIGAEGANLSALRDNEWRGVSGHIDHVDLTGPQRIAGQTLNIEYIDGISTVVQGWHRHGDVEVTAGAYLKAKPLAQMQKCYVARQGDTYAHGATLRDAIGDLRFKILSAKGRDEVAQTIRDAGHFTRETYRALTGACASGVAEFLASRGISDDQKTMPIAQVLELTRGAYGGEIVAKYFAAD